MWDSSEEGFHAVGDGWGFGDLEGFGAFAWVVAPPGGEAGVVGAAID
jgi:hypothetical protein